MRNYLEISDVSEGWLFDYLSTLILQMDRLKISTPPMDQRGDWVRWLVLMVPFVETRNIGAARK